MNDLKERFENKIDKLLLESEYWFLSCDRSNIFRDGAVSVYPILEELVSTLEVYSSLPDYITIETVGDYGNYKSPVNWPAKTSFKKLNEWLGGGE